MDYARRQRDPTRHMLGIAFVVLLHALVIYALVTGLARKVVEVIKKPIDVIDCPAYAPDPSIRPEPIQMRSSGSRGGPRPSGSRSGNRAGNPSRSSAPRAPSSAAKPSGAPHRNGSRHR